MRNLTDLIFKTKVAHEVYKSSDLISEYNILFTLNVNLYQKFNVKINKTKFK